MLKNKRREHCMKGLTLIEVVISMAILALVGMLLLTVFTNGMMGILGAGKKSVSHFTAQNKMESNISNSTNLQDGVTSSSTSIVLDFSGKNYTINGRKVDVQYTYGDVTKMLTTFTTN